MRITAACPQALVADANQLSMVLAIGPADVNTYGEPGWQDAEGNLYAVASWPSTNEWVQVAQAELMRPERDEAEIVDMVAAQRAQAATLFSQVSTTATPAQITVCCGDDALEVLTGMGLITVSEADEP
jgi:hypothetical protein